jgi:hypothetical protein
MRLDTFLLADAVSAPPDGKFYILGGGITRLTVLGLPFAVPQIGVLIRLAIEEQEVGGEHEFGFELRDPDGEVVGPAPAPRFNATIPPPLEAQALVEGEQRFVVVALNIGGVLVGRRGLHVFSFLVDGETIGSIPLPVVVQPPDANQAGAQSRPGPNRAQRRHQQGPRR